MGAWQLLNRWFSGAGNRQPGLQSGESSGANASAKSISIDGALQLSACYACIRLISQSIAQLPIIVYDINQTTGERTVNRTHRLAILFGSKVNRWQTRQEYFETISYQLAMLGNDYSLIHRNGQKDITGLEPLMAPQMEVTLLDSGAVQYRYNTGVKSVVYSEDDIWHNKLFGNGIVGLNPLSYAKQSLGIASAAEDSVAKVYANGGKPSGVLSMDKVLKPDQRAAIRESFAELVNGSNDRMFILEAGVKWDKVSLSPQDIELLASRRFQIEDIARIFGVPSVMINDTSSSTAWGSGIQQITEGFYKFTLRSYLERYKASAKARLLKPAERSLIDIDFDVDALLSPSLAERIKMGKEAVTGALMAPNEWRLEEGMAPITGGDQLFMQQQMVPINLLGTISRPAMETKNETQQ